MKKAVLCFALALALSACDTHGLGNDTDADTNVLSRVMLLQNPIDSHNTAAGVFHSNTVSLDVPQTFGRIVVSTDKDGETPFDVDDFLDLTFTSQGGLVQTVTLQRNGGDGAPIGEQFVVSHLTTLAPGTYMVHAEWCNEFAPSGARDGAKVEPAASASPAWIVVLKH